MSNLQKPAASGMAVAHALDGAIAAKGDELGILLTVLAPPGRFDEKLKDVKGYYAFDGRAER